MPRRHWVVTVAVSHDKQIENLTVDRRVKLNRGYLEHELASQRSVGE